MQELGLDIEEPTSEATRERAKEKDAHSKMVYSKLQDRLDKLGIK